MWFLQEQERLKAEYMRRVQEHKQSAARTLSYDSTEPSSLLRAPKAPKQPVRPSPLKTRAGAPQQGTGHPQGQEEDEDDETYSAARTASYHTGRPTPTRSYHEGPT